MTKSTTAHAERVEFICNYVETVRTKWAEYDAPRDDIFVLPPAEIVREAISGQLNSRTGRPLRSPPRRAERPLGNVLHRLLAWHRSSGYLGGVLGVIWDCNDIAKERGLEITGRELYDSLDTLALLLTRGRSRAGDNWERALGGRLD